MLVILNTRSVKESRLVLVNRMADEYDVPRHVAHAIALYVDPAWNNTAFVREMRLARLVYAATEACLEDLVRKTVWLA